jgi:hypothetical protein
VNDECVLVREEIGEKMRCGLEVKHTPAYRLIISKLKCECSFVSSDENHTHTKVRGKDRQG